MENNKMVRIKFYGSTWEYKISFNLGKMLMTLDVHWFVMRSKRAELCRCGSLPHRNAWDIKYSNKNTVVCGYCVKLGWNWELSRHYPVLSVLHWVVHNSINCPRVWDDLEHVELCEMTLSTLNCLASISFLDFKVKVTHSHRARLNVLIHSA